MVGVFIHGVWFEWTVLSLSIGGVVLSLLGLITAWTDLHYLNSVNINGARRIAAFTAITKEGMRLLVQTIIMMVGLSLVLMAPPPPPYPTVPQSIMSVAGYGVITVFLSIWVIADYARRVQLEDMYDTLYARDGRRKTDPVIAAICKECKVLRDQATDHDRH